MADTSGSTSAAVSSNGMSTEPYWWGEAPRPALEPVAMPAEADVAVIGSGYTGLSAALTLARGGRSVIVLEAEEAGHGASSRNGGGVGTTPFKIGFEKTVAMLGRDRARRVWLEGRASVDHLAQLVENEQIRCHFARNGRFIGAWRPKDYEKLARDAEVLRREIDAEIEMVPRSEQQREIGTTIYHGGRFNPDNGTVHPGLLHQGLLERVLAAGARVSDRTRVEAVERDGAGFTLTTSRGTVRAGTVVAATNGYTAGAIPWLQRRVIPVASQIIATEELPEETVRRLVPRLNMIIDTKRTVNYYRASPDGRRILMGGRPTLRDAPIEVSARRLREFMVRVWPELADVRIAHAWGGKLGFTFDQLPHIGEHDGIHYAAGYMGSGVAMSVYLGHKVGLRILGDPQGETALDGRGFPTIPFYGGNPWFLGAVAAYYRLRDNVG